MKWKGFTLVELLVVISIIAMLLAVLMPALGKAREQAKVITCLANCKQVGTIIAAYRSEYNGAVPIVFNRWAKNTGGVKVKNSYISIALRNYSEQTKHLPSSLDPEGTWGLQYNGKVATYVEKYLPSFYICPFARGKATETDRKYEGTVAVNGTEFTKQNFKGKFETFSTFAYGRVKDEDMAAWWGIAPGLRPKYAALPWNSTYDNYGRLRGLPDLENPIVWEGRTHLSNKIINGVQVPIKISSLSEATVSYCVMGESRDYDRNLTSPNIIFNYKSHHKQNSGGSSAIFADTHAAWVPGDQIGWH
ncbi:MAG: type II secretion system GspH family protein [Planctomycetaceae bacterium]|nr:type II secretion system GspH family protein [Planctomycetaceae bacterium]